MLIDLDLDPERVSHLDRPHWRWSDGTLLPVVSGGATEDGDGDPKDPKPDDPPKGDPPPKSDEDWKKHARTWEQRAKENADAAKKLKELEDSNKSELTKAQEAQQAEAMKASAAELRALRAEVALEKGLSSTLAKRLQGSSRDEIEADADDLLAEFGTKDGKGPASKPKERLRGGGDPTEEPPEDPRKLAERIPRF